MKANCNVTLVLAALSAVIVFGAEPFGGKSSVLASEKQFKGGKRMSASKTEGSATGHLSLNGKKIELNHAYALAQPNAFDEKKLDIAVLLTEQPIPESEFKGIEGLEFIAHKIQNYAFFKINDQGKSIHEMIRHPMLKETRLVMSGFTRAQWVPQTLNKELIEGSFKTEGSQDFSGYQYEISVKLSAPIQKAKLPEPLPDEKTGKALPSDGGDPAKAYFAYRKAIEKRDVVAIRKLFQPPAGIEFSDDKIKANLEFMESMSPKNGKFTKGYANSAGDRAVVYLSATEKNEKLYGTIVLIKKGNTWMVAEEGWSDTPPKR